MSTTAERTTFLSEIVCGDVVVKVGYGPVHAPQTVSNVALGKGWVRVTYTDGTWMAGAPHTPIRVLATA